MKTQPRLLMLTHRFPYPPNRGDRIRSYNLLRVLTQKFRVTLASIADEPVSMAHQQHVENLCEQVIFDLPNKISRPFAIAKSVATRKSITEGMFASPTLSKQINQLHQANRFDAVLVFCSSMFPYIDQPIFKDVPVVVDLVDVDSCKWEQMGQESGFPKNKIFRRECKHIRTLEQRIADTADAVTLVSDDEATVYRDTVNVPESQSVLGVSNGVDTDYFNPDFMPDLASADHESKTTGQSNDVSPAFDTNSPLLRLVFTGVLNYYPNVAGMEWFCREVLPELQKKIDVSLKIVGRSPNPQIESLDKLPGVEVVGPVPDVRPYLAESDVAISPLQLARGIQNKVLEAMAMGCPVVCTTPSAEGIAGDNGDHFIVVDTVSDWCDSLIALAGDRTRRERMSIAARDLVVSDYAWPAKLQPMLELLQPT